MREHYETYFWLIVATVATVIFTWTTPAHGATSQRPFELHWARRYNRDATRAHTPDWVAAIACVPWKAGLDTCDVVFKTKPSGKLSCAVLALETPSGRVIAGQIESCPWAKQKPAPPGAA